METGTTQAAPTGVQVVVAADGLSAEVMAPRGGAVPRDVVLTALRNAGVLFGVDAGALVRLTLGDHPGQVTIAHGLAPVPGVDARVEHFSLELASGGAFTAVEDDHGAVDLHGGHLTQHVRAGQIVATKVPATPGTPGRKVTGQALPARPGADLVLAAGPGAELSPDRLSVIAKVGGLPQQVGTTIAVHSVCAVKNVDLQSGDIHFVGSVTVEGDVANGFTVEATEDIEVKGHVDGGKLRAGGKITVGGGVRRAAELEALHDVTVRFVDPQCTLKSHGLITVKESALQCTLTGKRILVGRQLSAGTSTAIERIEATQIGNPNEVATHLYLRAEPAHLSGPALDAARAQLAATRAELERVHKGEESAGKDAKLLKTLTLREVVLELNLLRLEEQLARVDAPKPTDPHPGYILVKNVMHPGVFLHLYHQSKKLTSPLVNQTVRLVGDRIVP
jgi:hypothetical protein